MHYRANNLSAGRGGYVQLEWLDGTPAFGDGSYAQTSSFHLSLGP